MQLTDIEKKILAGGEGEAKQIAMEILTNIGEAMEADSFVQVSSVQAMAHFGSLHIAGRDWLEKLACMGGNAVFRPLRTRLPYHSSIGRRWATTVNTPRTSTGSKRPS